MLLDTLKADAPPLALSLTREGAFPETKSFIQRTTATVLTLNRRYLGTIPPLVLTPAKGITSPLAEAMPRNVTKALATQATRRRLHVVTYLRAPKSKVNPIWSLCVLEEMKKNFICMNLSIIAVSAEAATNSSQPLILKIGQESLTRVCFRNAPNQRRIRSVGSRKMRFDRNATDER